jgi:5-methylcytosine-specific restriction enzyme B
MIPNTDDPNVRRIYEALDLFRSRCLSDRKSLVLDDERGSGVWTVTSAQELMDRFVESPDVTKRSFIEKLTDQLVGASSPAVQLLTELTWLHVVISNFYKPNTKRRIIAEVAGVGGGAEVPEGLADSALEAGLASTGTSFVTRRPNQLWLLVRFAHGWVAGSESDNQELLADPWKFREFVYGLDGIADQTERNALLHLIHPATFEDCVSQYYKADIAEAFARPEEVGDNIDRTLFAIRERLSDEYGNGFNYYVPPIVALWKHSAPELHPSEALPEPDDAPIDVFVERRAWLVRGAGGERVPAWLQRGLCAIYFEDSFPFAVEPGVSREELRKLAENAGTDTSAGGFSNELGQVWRFVNSIEVGDFVVTVNAQEIYLGVVNSPARSVGDRARSEIVRSVEWLNADRPVMRGNISPTIYSKLKTLLTLSNITSVIDELELWAAGQFPQSAAVAAKIDVADLPSADAALSAKTLFPVAWLDEIIELLIEKKQIVLYGPPGTSKTFLAQELADHITANGGEVELVQFHPSYAYEDFFEGYRPVGSGTSVGFEVKPGPFKRIAMAAADAPTKPHVLIIDEINRANLAKGFGEMYFLLEYRNRPIALQYSDNEFTMPPNLYIIGTMNTADRSIALVDAAMRRRFYFIEMSPSASPVRELLASWLDANRLADLPARLLNELNARIGDPDAAIGPSYFMTDKIQQPGQLQRIWTHAIMPVLRERYFGMSASTLDKFTFEAIQAAISTGSP